MPFGHGTFAERHSGKGTLGQVRDFYGMPRFYFNIRENGIFIPDEEGIELADVDAAEAEAAMMAAGFGRKKLPKGRFRKIVVEVQNAARQKILTATVSLEVVRCDPAPQGRP